MFPKSKELMDKGINMFLDSKFIKAERTDIREIGKCCTEPLVSDLTDGKGEHRNFMCHNCNAHEWKGKFYNNQEWENYVNDVVAIIDGFNGGW